MTLAISPTPLPGLLLLHSIAQQDERGGFARLHCAEAMAEAGFRMTVQQTNLSTNPRRHTLRGLHWQDAPAAEAKIVRCVAGSVWDVAVDLRPASPTFRRWYAEELSAANGRALAIPEGFAHGFITLTGDAAVLYLMGARYAAALARGARYDDPAFAIAWPAAPALIGARDLTFPPFGTA
ncbi:dTDP-4-dehydrorhamnose 3,5-epimerase family protein [Elioraea sp.]|uniref:dTDP-4-dehydrorhamnose 3,5-epimerase family protein n=1 Tax=Elioraea sp. TaxID=2185103 RepID=UPI0025B7E078|nr:dTDP-4-dehydrorhamnose 3,5-epimerase [Elioraea sp.]